ncbi:MAG: aldo/keto reductase [Rhodospirillaceae bacterium]|nr:aldo/keto reductase [Rhodospirillaceae bacterium]MBT6426043.1 aldo/keto reductase [Rhodospirillaceae bacterium]MBT7758518.1 aldo/keto reductase [Rhodospirillaceae bacterium]
MQRRSFGKTGLEVSILGFGGAPVGFLETEQRDVADILNGLLDQGVNLIDTAAGYSGSEEMIGKTIGGRRDDYILVSKCGRAMEGVEGAEWSEEVITNTLDRALARLQTDHLDVMLLHTCDLETLKAGEAVGALVKARDAGKIRFLGYAGDNEAAAYAAQLDDVAVIETSVSICDQANIENVLAPCRENNVGVLSKRSIANAAWKGAAQQRGMYVNYAENYAQRLEKMAITPEDLGFSGPEDWPEIALRFTLFQPGLSCAIVGTTKPGNVTTNLAAAAKGPLPEDAAGKIRAAFRQAEAATGETWLGLQ